jgi:hypothetical protein
MVVNSEDLAISMSMVFPELLYALSKTKLLYAIVLAFIYANCFSFPQEGG